jgi:beta-1,4-mannosyltransferase
MTMTRLLVAMWPHRKNFDVNPYTALLADPMQRCNVEVIEFGWNLRSFFSDVVHFHWPNDFFNTPTVQRQIQVWKNLLWLAMFRAKGGHVVWTVHNAWPHDQSKRRSLQLRTFLALIDGIIFLNRTSKDIVLAEYAILRGKKSAVIPHGSFDELFSIPSKQKKYTPHCPVRLGYFGLIRPYKQLDRLLNCMKDISTTEASLAVAGTSFGYPELEQQIKELARGLRNVHLSLAHLTHDQLMRFVDDSDAVILPYRDILNSGAAILALSRQRPIMVPSLGGMLELKEAVGANWVFCYSGDLTSEKFREFIGWVKTTPRDSPPDMTSFDPEIVAASTVRFYHLLKQ